MKLAALIVGLAVGGSSVQAADLAVVVSAATNPRAPRELVAAPRPLSYRLVVGEYQEIGEVSSNLKPIDRAQLAAVVQAALPAEQFVLAPEPDAASDLLIACHYGEVGREGPQVPVMSSRGRPMPVAAALLVGRDPDSLLLQQDRARLATEAGRDRYFLLVTAYAGSDPKAASNSVVWQTRVSADSLDANATEVWRALAQAGREYYGQNLSRPAFPVVTLSPQPAMETTTVARLEDVLPRRLANLELAIF